MTESTDDLRLARLAADGDDQAFAQMFERFRDHLRRFVDLRLDPRIRARVDPSDILQETQIEVHRRLKDFLERNPMPLRVWLRQTAKEKMLDVRDKHLRAAKRSVSREAVLNRESSIMLARRIVDDGPSPSQRQTLRERQQKVTEAIAQLTEMDQEILTMRNIEDLDFNEIGSTLDITPETARKRYGRALLRLQKQIRSVNLGDDD